DVNSFAVICVAVNSWPFLSVMSRCVGGRSREGYRQLSRRIDVAEEYGREGSAVFLTGIPSLDHSFDLVEPRHRHGASGIQHDDHIRIRAGHLADQGVLLIGKREIWTVVAFAFLVAGEDDRDVSAARGVLGGSVRVWRRQPLEAEVGGADGVVVLDLDRVA